MKNLILTLSTLLFVNSAHAQLAELLQSVQVPEAQAFKGWTDKTSWATEVGNPFEAKRLSLDCANKILVPTHPQQSSKKYHQFLYGRYDHFKVSPKSNVCRIKSKSDPVRCLQADAMEFAMMSDTYQDFCGNFYRGYWTVAFLKRDESMGSLFSKGRWNYPDPKSQFENDMKEGPTYTLQEDDFLFLAALLPGDQKQMSEDSKRALKFTHDLNPQTLLFLEKQN